MVLAGRAAVFSGDFDDLRNRGSSQLVAFLMFLLMAVGIVVLAVLVVKAVQAEGLRRAGWLVLCASVILLLLAPLPLVVDVTIGRDSVQCGHPLLSRPDIQAARLQPGGAAAADACLNSFSRRRALAAQTLLLAVAGVLIAGGLFLRAQTIDRRSARADRSSAEPIPIGGDL
jgi:hypothetical protein